MKAYLIEPSRTAALSSGRMDGLPFGGKGNGLKPSIPGPFWIEAAFEECGRFQGEPDGRQQGTAVFHCPTKPSPFRPPFNSGCGQMGMERPTPSNGIPAISSRAVSRSAFNPNSRSVGSRIPNQSTLGGPLTGN